MLNTRRAVPANGDCPLFHSLLILRPVVGFGFLAFRPNPAGPLEPHQPAGLAWSASLVLTFFAVMV